MVICVGGVGAGKTLLLSALCQPASFSPDSPHVPTVGVNIFTLNTRHNKSVNIRLEDFVWFGASWIEILHISRLFVLSCVCRSWFTSLLLS